MTIFPPFFITGLHFFAFLQQTFLVMRVAMNDMSRSPRKAHRKSDSPGAAAPPSGVAPDSGLLSDQSLVPVRARQDGWNRERQRGFIEHLADGMSVCDAARAVGMTDQSAYRLRRRADAAGFAAAWDAAIGCHGQFLYQIGWQRGVEGVTVPHFHGGKEVGERRVYSDRMLIYLMERQRRAAPGPTSARMLGNWEGAMEALASGTVTIAAEDLDPYTEEIAEEPLADDSYGVWFEGGEPYTNFPPPDDFAGEQRGGFGEFGYRRALTPGERACAEDMAREDIANKRAAAEAQRIEFFEGEQGFEDGEDDDAVSANDPPTP